MIKNGFEDVLNFFSEPQTRVLSELYLKKYWLGDEEWANYWKRLKDKIFQPEFIGLPEIIFKEKFVLIAMKGGVIFTESDFNILRQCMLDIGDEWFVIIENKDMQPIIKGDDGKAIVQPLLRFKFPVKISWSELLSGGLISMEIFQTSYKEFFVFGSSAKWGKYAANEYWDTSVNPTGTPLDIIGFESELMPVFQKHFKQIRKEQEAISDWLPKEYKKLIEL